mgnify:CR=1 FL=1
MIKIKNIYYMLSYAFQTLAEKGYEKVGTEEFDNISDLFSAILIKGVSTQIKRGLEKEYKLYSDEISTVKGKVDISESINRQSLEKKKACCSFDELTVDSYMNRIIKTTFYYLLKSDASIEHKKQIKKLLIYFDGVEFIPINQINWKIQYNKNNKTYRMLLGICNLVIKGLLQTEESGDVRLTKFLDEQKMCRLYEKFILEFYRKEVPSISANASKIEWQLDDGFDDLLPEMKSDIMLSCKNKVLIIDAKYYEQSTQQYYEIDKLHSGNVYQIFTYVKNKQEEDQSKEVAGMLLYAKTDVGLVPNVEYKMSGNKISARTLDLNTDFQEIRKQLLNIVEDFFLLA